MYCACYKAAKKGDIPVGALVVCDGKIVARSGNRREIDFDPTAHAEVIVLRRAGKKLGRRNLSGCTLYVTLEPCVMCSGAIINSRMRSVYFGAYDPEYGGAGGRIDLFSKSYFGSNTTVYGGIMEDECTSMLKDFFAQLRKDKKK